MYTLYNGIQTITTKYDSVYTLYDECRGGGISTTNWGNSLITHDNVWNEGTQRTASAHWAAEMVYDYYLQKHNRNSYDDNGALIIVQTGIPPYIGPSQCNATWFSNSNNNINKIFCGLGNNNDTLPVVSLDALGHEFTHGVILYSSQLNIVGESGALNESFADIFGTMVEFFIEGDNGDFLIGEDIVPEHMCLRNMKEPNQKGQADTYHGNYWYSGNDDREFIHRNCGVQNYWFYLLAEGGEGVNDNNYHYQVQGIGREKAAKIAYRNMVHYMNSSCDYSDARNGAILSAVDLFGPHSDEVLSTVAAWDAVGVNNAGDLYYDYVTVCSLLETIHNVQGNPVSSIAIHNIISTCSYVPNQVPVQYYAGGTITLNDGFCSGNNFSAVIFPTTLPSSYPDNMSYLSGPRTSSGTDDTTPNIGQERQDMPSVNIFPNPSRDIITILSDMAMLRVTLFDITGKQISYNQYPDNGITSSDIDVRSLPSGIYMVQALLEDGSIVTKRVIKE